MGDGPPLGLTGPLARVERMDVLHDVFLVIHFVGLASLLGGVLVQMSAEVKHVNPAMWHGALTQLVTGLAMVAVMQADDDPDLNNAKFGLKLLVLVAIFAVLWLQRGRQAMTKGVYFAIGGLTLANIVIAVFWH